MSQTVEMRLGQSVVWPPSPVGLAQVSELRRNKVRITYRCRSGRWRHPVVAVRKLVELTEKEPPLPLVNLFGRGVLKKQKTFELK